jgi:hypothetical protein
MKTSVKNAQITLLPQVGHYHCLHCGPPTQVGSTLWVGPKNEGVSATLSVTGCQTPTGADPGSS